MADAALKTKADEMTAENGVPPTTIEAMVEVILEAAGYVYTAE